MKFKSVTKTAMILVAVVYLILPAAGYGADPAGLEESFNGFLKTYIKEIKKGNRDYLAAVHPNLPGEIHDFFIEITINMMKHSDEEGLSPEITCRDYDICKVTWTQADGSWAAQSFILHESKWRWLDQ